MNDRSWHESKRSVIICFTWRDSALREQKLSYFLVDSHANDYLFTGVKDRWHLEPFDKSLAPIQNLFCGNYILAYMRAHFCARQLRRGWPLISLADIFSSACQSSKFKYLIGLSWRFLLICQSFLLSTPFKFGSETRVRPQSVLRAPRQLPVCKGEYGNLQKQHGCTPTFGRFRGCRSPAQHCKCTVCLCD